MSNLKNDVVLISDTDTEIINISEISVIGIHTIYFFNFDETNSVDLTLKFEDNNGVITPFSKKTLLPLDEYYYPVTIYLNHRNKLKAQANLSDKIQCFVSYSILLAY